MNNRTIYLSTNQHTNGGDHLWIGTGHLSQDRSLKKASDYLGCLLTRTISRSNCLDRLWTIQ